jgi:hypothetical protein
VIQFSYSKSKIATASEKGAAAISVYTAGCTVWGLSYESCVFSYCCLLGSVSSNCLCQHVCFAEADKYCDYVSAALNLLPYNDREILSISICFYVWFVYWPSKTLKTDYKSVCMGHKFRALVAKRVSWLSLL